MKQGNTSGSELVSKTLDILAKLVQSNDGSATDEDEDAALKCFMQLFVHEVYLFLFFLSYTFNYYIINYMKLYIEFFFIVWSIKLFFQICILCKITMFNAVSF